MNKLLAAVAFAALLLAFDYMMEQDAKRLCSNDATAYEECSE